MGCGTLDGSSNRFVFFGGPDVLKRRMDDEVLSCVALTLIPGLGTTRLHQLLHHLESPGQLLRLPAHELARLRISKEARAYITSPYAYEAAQEVVRNAERKGVKVLSIFDAEYPFLLKQIFDPPLVLYCRGRVSDLCQPSIAVVGSRRCSVYGKEVTRKMSRGLSALGLGIVSGLARGIDSEAHIGALEGGGPTVAVLGNGVDVIYPRENRKLYRGVCGNGCVVSEFPCGTIPAPQNFPIRNRIISGLCRGTLITEASEFSGSLITARLTLEQGRELWAVPGNITSPGSYGPNFLIKQGAKAVVDRQDVLEELPPYVLGLLDQETPKTPTVPGRSLPPSAQAVLDVLPTDKETPFDQILRTSGLSISQLNEVLLRLEMKGLVRQWPGKVFTRKFV